MDISAIDNAIRRALSKLQFKEIRSSQMEDVTSFANGRDVFVALPTGSGKSLCFWILPWLFNSLKEATLS